MMKSIIAALMVAATNACANEWIWEECSWSWFRYGCPGEIEGDNGDECGWIYWDDWNQEEKEVTCKTFDTWPSCWED